MTSKHRARQTRAYAAGARDALDNLQDEIKWMRPTASVMSTMDMLIKKTRAKFPMPAPIDEDRERVRAYYSRDGGVQ